MALRKRSVLAWVTVAVLGADALQEGLRLVVCSPGTGAQPPAICTRNAGTVETLAVKVHSLLSALLATDPPSPGPAVAPSQPQTKMDRIRQAPGL